MAPSDGNCSATASAPIPDLNDARLFCNRELSLLAFQKRVLEEARDESNPLLDRLTFLSIFGSNLDEFFMVRVAVLKQRVASGLQDAGVDGFTGTELLEAIRAEVLQLAAQGYTCLRDGLRPALEEANLRLLDYSDLDNAGRAVPERLFSADRFSGPHAPGIRPRPSLPAHFQPESESGCSGERCEGRRAFCQSQSTQHPSTDCARRSFARIRLARTANRRESGGLYFPASKSWKPTRST